MRAQPIQPDSLFECCDGLECALRVYPGCIPWIDVEGFCWNWWNAPTGSSRLGRRANLLRHLWRKAVEYTLTVLRHERVEIYQGTNSLRNTIGDTTDYHTAIRVSAENDIRKIFPLQQVDNVRDVSRKINRDRVEMRAIGKPCKSRRKHQLAGVAQFFVDSLPAPAAMPCSMHQNISSLVLRLLFIRYRQIETSFVVSSGIGPRVMVANFTAHVLRKCRVSLSALTTSAGSDSKIRRAKRRSLSERRLLSRSDDFSRMLYEPRREFKAASYDGRRSG